MSADHYGVLGVAPTADAAQIRRAFRAQSRRHHPDLGGDHLLYARITTAYAVLSDPASREAYDRGAGLSGGGGAPPGEAPTAGEREPSGTASRRPVPRAGGGGLRHRPVTLTGAGPGAATPAQAAVSVHGSVPRRGLFDRSREARAAACGRLLRLVAREVPAARAVLGVDVPGAGRHDAVIVAGRRAVLVDALPTPDVPHAWDGRTLRVAGRAATLPDVAAAAHGLERAGGTRAEGLVLLYTGTGDGFRPVVDTVGPVHAAPGPATPSRPRSACAPSSRVAPARTPWTSACWDACWP